MPGDSYQRELLKELRSLRRVEGQPDEARLAGLYRLARHLGNGSIKAAYVQLMKLANEVGADEETDIHAYFFTIGLGVGGHNLDDRLKRYAATYHVVEMTALRRSNRGAVALSHLIRDRGLDQRPEVMIWLTQDRARVQFTATFYFVAGTTYTEPSFYVNGGMQNLDDLEWSDWGGGENLRQARRRLTVDLDDSVLQQEKLVSFHIWWMAELLPTFELRTTLADSRLMPTLRVSYDNRASIELYWQHHEDMCRPSGFAKSSYKFGE